MGQILKILATIFIIIYLCDEITGDGDYIILKDFERMFIINKKGVNQAVKDDETCDNVTISSDAQLRDDHLRTRCTGRTADCETFGTFTNQDELHYCKEEEHIVWANLSDTTVGLPTKTCKNGTLLYDSKSDLLLDFCVCHCFPNPKLQDVDQLWRFSLAPQISEDKIVTGIRFKNVKKTIHLEILENDIDCKGKGVWKTSTEDFDEGTLEKDKYVYLSHDSRYLQLGDIIVRDGHVITGAKFNAVLKDNLTVVTVEVQSKKVNFDENSFDGEETWISFDQSSNRAIDTWWPEMVFQDVVTDKQVMFRARNIREDGGIDTVPVISTRATVSCARKDYPLQGLQISNVRVTSDRYGVFFRIAPYFRKRGDATEEDGENYDDDSSATSISYSQFTLIAMLPLSIIFNYLN